MPPGCTKHPQRAVISCSDCYSDDLLQQEIARLQATAPPSAPATKAKRPKRMDSTEGKKKRSSVFDQLGLDD